MSAMHSTTAETVLSSVVIISSICSAAKLTNANVVAVSIQSRERDAVTDAFSKMFGLGVIHVEHFSIFERAMCPPALCPFHEAFRNAQETS